MSPFLRGFAGELIKTSAAYTIPERGVTSMGKNLLGIIENKKVQKALKHGGALGAIQGAAAGLVGDGNGHRMKNVARGAAGGAVAGALGGAAFPHWFA